MRYVLFGAGDAGRKLCSLMEHCEVLAFVDNNKILWGKTIGGLVVKAPIYLKTIPDDVSVVVSVFEEYQKAIIKQIKGMGIDRYILPSDLLKNITVSSDAGIRTLQGRFQSERCFVIGTGPSLTVHDLEVLKAHNEITFASNKIFKIFDRTTWRPQLYCISDIDVFAYYYDQICNMDSSYKFLVDMRSTQYENLDFSKQRGDGKYVFRVFKEMIFDEKRKKEVPMFSTNPDRYVVDGGLTVTYSMLQWAYFLGFRQVYLLGVDFDYRDLSGNDAGRRDHFCPDYMEEGETVNYPKIRESLDAYITAREFADAHDFHIYNATRGGNLEVFERVDFDTLFLFQ